MKTTTPFRVIICFFVALAIFMATFGAIGLTGSKPVMRENDDVALRSLRNECAIVATVAYERIRATGAWVQVLHVNMVFPDGRLVGHAMVVWQIRPGAHICIYDQTFIDGTAEMNVRERSVAKIVLELQQHLIGVKVVEAHFLN